MDSIGRREGFIARRKHLDYSQESLAHYLNVSVSAVTSWERGRRLPSPGMRRNLADALQVSLTDLDRLLGIEPPIELNGHEVPDELSLYESLVEAAGAVAHVEKVAIPGLLQTRAYASAVERYGPRPLTEHQIMDRVEVRLARQLILHRDQDPLVLRALIAEGVLRENLGSEIMADQLDHLAEIAQLPNIEVRLIPADGRAVCVRAGYELLSRASNATPFIVITFDVDGPRYVEQPSLVTMFASMFDHLCTMADTPSDSLRRIIQIRKTYR